MNTLPDNAYSEKIVDRFIDGILHRVSVFKASADTGIHKIERIGRDYYYFRNNKPSERNSIHKQIEKHFYLLTPYQGVPDYDN